MKRIRLSIPTLTFLVLITLTFTLLAVFSLLWLNTRKNNLTREFEDNKRELLVHTHDTLKKLVNTSIEFIQIGRKDFNRNTRRQLKIDTIKLKDICLQSCRDLTSPEEKIKRINFILNIISNATDPERSEPFPFIIFPDTSEVIFPSNVFMNILSNMSNTNTYNQDHVEMIRQIISETKSNMRGYYHQSLFYNHNENNQLIENKCYTLYIPQLNIIVGSSYYDKNIEIVARKYIFSYISLLGRGEDEYVYILDNRGTMLYHPEESMMNSNLIDARDENGLKLTRKAIEIGTTKSEGGFMNYTWLRLSNMTPAKKLGFSKGLPELGWIINSTIFLADFDQLLKTKKLDMENSLHHDLIKALYLLLLIIILDFIVSSIIYFKVKSYIEIFSTRLKTTIEKRSHLDAEKFDLIELEELTNNTNNIISELFHAESELKDITANLENKVEQRTRELQVKTLELEESMKLANSANNAKSSFLANMSHEIRTPMNIILGMQQLLLDSNISHTQHNYLDKANQAALSLLGIINDILDFSKIEAGKMHIEKVRLSIEETLDNVLSFLSFEATQKDIELIFDHDLNIPKYVIGDPLRLRQIISNICNNSIKFSSRSNIIVTSRIEKTENSRIHISFEIQDNGIGIPIEKQKNLFKPFKQADNTITRKFGGTGLGLVICKQLIELQGGQISFRSIPGIGTTFKFTIPFDTLESPGKELYPVSAEHRACRVMIIDKNTHTLNILKKYAESDGYSVDTATTLSEACNLLDEKVFLNPPYHSIIINSILSNTYGMEAYIYLVKHFSLADTNFILMTKQITPEIIKSSKQVGFNTTLGKPISPQTLLNTLNNPHDIPATTSKILHSSKFKTAYFNQTKILVVEDNEANQEIIRTLLEKSGCIVTLADNGQKAIDLIKTNLYDLIFMDIQMPVMDGLTATYKIREFNKSVPIIAMTAHALREDREKSLQCGMNDHITKPIKMETLFEIMYRYLTTTLSEETVKDSAQAFSDNEINTDNKVHDNSAHNTEQIWQKLIKIPQLNLHEALENIGGDKSMLVSVYKIYADSSDKMLDELSTAFTTHNMHEFLRLAHSLKGSCGTIGETRIHSIANTIQSKLRQDINLDITSEYKELIEELKVFSTAISRIFKRK